MTAEIEGAEAVILSRSNRLKPRELDAHMYKKRNQVERLFAKLKQCRRAANPLQGNGSLHFAFRQLASVMIPLA